MAKKLGITRSAIWKHLQAISHLDIEIIAVSGKGYRLAKPLELLDKNSIQEGLNADVDDLISSFHLTNQIDSTNNFFVSNPVDVFTGLEVCLAEQQTAGRGRRGRFWISPFGANIYLSLLKHYQVGPSAISGLSLAVGIGVAKALSKAGLHEVALKWPNDIYWRYRKLGGILVELAGEAGGPCQVVVGIGLNLYLTAIQAQAIDQDWVDLEQISRILKVQFPTRNQLVACLLNEIVPIINQYESTGFDPFAKEWGKWDAMRGKKVNFYTGNSAISGEVQGINSQGLLLIRSLDGQTKAYASGEISFNSSQ